MTAIAVGLSSEQGASRSDNKPTTAADVANHLIADIEAAPPQDEPFEHIRLRQPFAPATYAAIRANLPADRYFVELRHSDAIRPDGTSARTNMVLSRFTIGGLPEHQRRVWLAVRQGLTDRRVQHALKRKFARAMTRRFSAGPEIVGIYPYLALTRDLVGYKISPHCDSGLKAITVQLYLPQDDAHADIGTRFHALDPERGLVHRTTMPFVPNTGYAFPVTASSWHSVDEISESEAPRFSLLLIYYVIKHPVIRGLERIKETGQAIQGRFLPMLRHLVR